MHHILNTTGGRRGRLLEFTIAVSVAAILAGPELADANKEKELAQDCRAKADEWNNNIEKWTYVTGTSLEKKNKVEGYYIRINPYKNITADELGTREMHLKNHKYGKGKIRVNELVNVDA